MEFYGISHNAVFLSNYLSINATLFSNKVDVTSASDEHDGKVPLHLYKLDVRDLRLRRVLYGRVTSYPVIEQIEKQMSRPFYFRQKEHGTIVDVLFPKDSELPQVAAFKKGMISHHY